jgi:cytochrome oxidase Cu insertion factor (SCO1/SenC/PrrC family)
MTARGRLACAALWALACPALAHHPGDAPEAVPAAQFVVPAAGTYSLPPIQDAPVGEVVDASGYFRLLDEYTHGRITLLGLVYTRCTDPEGCPRATWAFSAVRNLLRAHPSLQRRVRLVTLSFDPVHDRFDAMAAYGEQMRGPRGGAEWHFLTTPSKRALAPILDGLGQDLRVAVDSQALPGTEEFTHSLKVFLIDPDARVREIYSTAYLVPQVIVNDMRTLAAEYPRPGVAGRDAAIRTR